MIKVRLDIEHPMFNTLEKLCAFYKSLSYTASDVPSKGITSHNSIDALIFLSIQTTLDSIYHLLKNAKLNDAWSLLRKYFDVVEINIYTMNYLDQKYGIDKSLIVQRIENWVRGEKKLPERNEMLKNIFKTNKVNFLNSLFFKLIKGQNNKDKIIYKKKYQEIRERCNNNLHYKHYQFLKMNFRESHQAISLNVFDVFFKDIISIFTLHIAYIFFINYYYMKSSDYVDALESGLEPKEDSQYWVAPFVQDIFDDIVKKENPRVYEFIKENTCMELQ